jgi:hypothetical protein
VHSAAVATVPAKQPSHVINPNLEKALKSVRFVLLKRALLTNNISPVHAPQPVQEISNILRGKPIAPDRSLATPLPASHGAPGTPPISKPTEAVRMPKYFYNISLHDNQYAYTTKLIQIINGTCTYMNTNIYQMMQI